jgi:hypothetical protein
MTTTRPTSFRPLLAAFLLAGGCGSGSPQIRPFADASSDGPALRDAGPDAAPVDTRAVPADVSPDTGAASDGAAAVGFFPCDVEKALKAKCHTCHTDPQMNGAPFSLLEYADTQVEYGQGVKIWERMQYMVEMDFMPPEFSTTGPLTPAEKTTLLTWFSQGAPPARTRCSTF